MAYATIDDVQARVPTQLCQIGETSQPSYSVVESWLDQKSAWIDATLRWKYVVPITHPLDRELLRPICAMLVAAEVWDMVGGHGNDQPNAGATLRKEARIMLAYDVGSGLRVSSGQANIVLPNSTLADTGEAAVAQPISSFTDSDDAPMFSRGMNF